MDGGTLKFPQAAGSNVSARSLKIYPKAITQDPTKTSVIIMGELSGAVIEFDVTIAYDTSAT